MTTSDTTTPARSRRAGRTPLEQQLRRIRWAVRGTFLLGVAASTAANVLHAADNPISQAIAAWPPLALLLTVELISRVPMRSGVQSVARVLTTALIAGIAAWVSYWHMVGVARHYGETGAAPYLLPLSVDGLIVVASICLVELGGRIGALEVAAAPAPAAAPPVAGESPVAAPVAVEPPAAAPVVEPEPRREPTRPVSAGESPAVESRPAAAAVVESPVVEPVAAPAAVESPAVEPAPRPRREPTRSAARAARPAGAAPSHEVYAEAYRAFVKSNDRAPSGAELATLAGGSKASANRWKAENGAEATPAAPTLTAVPAAVEQEPEVTPAAA